MTLLSFFFKTEWAFSKERETITLTLMSDMRVKTARDATVEDQSRCDYFREIERKADQRGLQGSFD